MTRESLADMHPFWRGFWFGGTSPGWKWGPINCITPAGDQVQLNWCRNRGHSSVAFAKAHAAAVQRRIETTGR
jgi:hypothetical protein